MATELKVALRRRKVGVKKNLPLLTNPQCLESYLLSNQIPKGKNFCLLISDPAVSRKHGKFVKNTWPLESCVQDLNSMRHTPSF